MIPFVAHVLVEQPGDRNQHARLRMTCLWGLADFLHVLDTQGHWLDRHARARVKHAATAYLMCYQHLSREAHDDGKLLWKVLPKHHYFGHMVRDAWTSGWNCRFDATFALEDFGGHVAKLNRNTHGETDMSRTMQRHLVGLALLWESIVRGASSEADIAHRMLI